MTKKTNRKHRNNWARLISGLFVGGVILFQGTGYITGSLAAAEENNQNIDVVNGGQISSTEYNSGLFSSNEEGIVSAAVTIDNGAAAVIGQLDTETSERILTDKVALTMDAVNLTVGGDASAGTLYIGGVDKGGNTVASSLILNTTSSYDTGLKIGTGTGTAASEAASKVIVEDGSSLVNNYGQITIGGEKDKITGSLSVLGTGKLKNEGTLTVNQNGSLVFGTKDKAVVGSEIFTGQGTVSNAGTITVYNEGEDEASTLTLNGYSDSSKGTLEATGKVFLSALGGDSLNGTIEAKSLQLVGASTDAVNIGTGAEITVTDSLQLGTVAAAETEAVTVDVTNDGDIYAGSLTLNNNSTLTNTGTLAADTLKQEAGTLSSTGGIYSKNMTLSGGTFNAAGTISYDAAGAEPGVLTLNGGTMNLTSKVTLTDMTMKVGSGTISSGDTDSVLSIGSGASFELADSSRTVDANMAVASEGNLDLTDNHTLTLAAGRNLTLEKGGSLSVSFTSGNTDPLIRLSEDDENKGGQITMKAGSTINVEGLQKIETGKYSMKVAEFNSTGNTFKSTLEDQNTAFMSLTDNRETAEDDGFYSLDLSVNNFESLGETKNQKEFGRYVDAFRVTGEYTEPTGGMIKDIMSLKTGEEVRAAYESLIPAERANGLMLAMTDPWQNAFDQMNWQTHRSYTKRGNPYAVYGPAYRGQMAGQVIYEEGAYGYYPGLLGSVFGTGNSLKSNSAWASFHYTSLNARTDSNSPQYGISRTGVSIGYDVINCAGVKAGLMFDYSQPFLYSNTQRINTGNFNLGLYGKREFYNQMELSLYLGGGFQGYTSKRTAAFESNDSIVGWNDYYRSTYNGNNVALAVQLARNYTLNAWSVLRPFVQFDMQQVWQDANAEKSDELQATALRYDKADWNRSFVRAGLESEVNNQFIRLTGRCFYSGQLNNASAPQVKAAFLGDNTGNAMTIQGVDIGRSFFDVGIGALGYFDCDYRWAISGNYDFAAGDLTSAHTGKVSLSYTF